MAKNTAGCIISLLILLFATEVPAQKFNSSFFLPSEDKIYLQELTFPNNQSISYFNAIAEDHKGYIWIGTFDELLRFNGHDFKSFSHKIGDPNSIAHSSITALFVVNDTLMLVGNELTLSLLNLKNYIFKNIYEANGTTLRSPTSFYISGNHVLVGAYNGLFDLDIRTSKISLVKINIPPTKFSPSPSYSRIYTIAKHPFKSNILLLGTESGLVSFDMIKKEVLQLYPNEALYNISGVTPGIYAILTDDQFAWTYSWDGGVNRLDLKTGKWTNYYLDGTTNVQGIFPLNSEEFLADFGAKGGIVVFDKKTGKIKGEVASLISGKMHLDGEGSNIFKQSNGTLWIGNFEGVCRQVFNYKTFKKVNFPFKYLWAWPIIEIPELERYYFRFTNGKNAVCYDKKNDKLTELKSPVTTPYPLEFINAARGPDGKVVLTTYVQGLVELDPKTNIVEQFRLKNGKALGPDTNFSARGVFFDSKNRLWIGTYKDGLYMIKPDRSEMIHYPLKDWNALRLNSMAEDKFGRIWIASTAGIILYDPVSGKFSDVVNEAVRKSDIVPDRVYSVVKDSLDRMWITMPFTGLLRIEIESQNNFHIKLFQKDQGLNNLNCNFMTTDYNGCLWIMNNGILYFNPYTESYRYINEWNGLLDIEGGDSRILVGSKGTVFLSDECKENLVQSIETAPESPIKLLAIDRLLVNGVPYTGSLVDNHPVRLSNSENNLTFFFSDICFDDPALIQYRYRIEGLEKQWNITNSLSEAHYNHLPPGKYTFVVNTGYRGEWLKNEARVAFIIKQPFWKSIWFMIGVILLVASILWLITIVRYRAKLNAERIRGSIASDLHDEINSTLSSISIMSDILSNNDKQDFVKKGILEINKNSKSLLNKMDDIIWLINPAKDNFEDFELRLKEFMIPLFESRNIEYNFECSSRIEHMHLPVEIRKNLFLIMKEAINNLVKYSQCSKAEVLIQYNSPVLTAVIRDNGIGFNPDAESNRNGIRNMRKRATQVKAVLNINSSDKNGTEIIFRINL
jgi:ligand-binding sensor domain-containing protein